MSRRSIVVLFWSVDWIPPRPIASNASSCFAVRNDLRQTRRWVLYRNRKIVIDAVEPHGSALEDVEDSLRADRYNDDAAKRPCLGSNMSKATGGLQDRFNGRNRTAMLCSNRLQTSLHSSMVTKEAVRRAAQSAEPGMGDGTVQAADRHHS